MTWISWTAGNADPLVFVIFVYILYMVNHCMGTYDGNCRTSTVAVDPFGESERNGRTPLVAATPRTQTET